MLLKKQTNKLFYKKFPYKITCSVNGANLLRIFPLEVLKRYCATGELKIKTWWKLEDQIRADLLTFILTIENYLESFQFRCEGSRFNAYFVSKKDFYKITKLLEPWTIETWEPASDEELEFLLKYGTKKIVCNHLPHKRYRYKAHLKFKTNQQIKENFNNWMKNYSGKIHAPRQTATWLNLEYKWNWNPSIYIEDSATLSLVLLFLGDAVLRVDEYTPKGNINTNL